MCLKNNPTVKTSKKNVLIFQLSLYLIHIICNINHRQTFDLYDNVAVKLFNLSNKGISQLIILKQKVFADSSVANQD